MQRLAWRPGRGGTRPGRPTAWLLEGLLIYLTATEAGRLLADITGTSAPGSRLAFEHGAAASRLLADRAGEIPTLRGVTALWKGGLGTGTLDWFTRNGWVVQLHDRANVAATLGRPDQDASGSGFVTATLQ